jgi:hypothetical protein
MRQLQTQHRATQLQERDDSCIVQLDLQPVVTVSLWGAVDHQLICTGSVIITYAINKTGAAGRLWCPLQRLRSRFPLFLSEFPIELRQYPKGAAMPWHKDEQMFASPQWEVRAAACAAWHL